jgi:hypothetical protein
MGFCYMAANFFPEVIGLAPNVSLAPCMHGLSAEDLL